MAKRRELGGFGNRNLFSLRPGGQQFEIQPSAEASPCEATREGCLGPASLLLVLSWLVAAPRQPPHGLPPVGMTVSHLPSHKDTCHARLGATLPRDDLVFTRYTCDKFAFPGSWGLMVTESGGTRFTHNSDRFPPLWWGSPALGTEVSSLGKPLGVWGVGEGQSPAPLGQHAERFCLPTL